MKHILLLITIMSPGLAVYGHHPHRSGSSLSVITGDRQYIQVFLDGYEVNSHPMRFVDAGVLRPGRHVLEVRTVGRHGFRFMSRIIHLQPGTEHQFVVNRFGLGENFKYGPVGYVHYHNQPTYKQKLHSRHKHGRIGPKWKHRKW